jgi:hypothetical protein
MLVLTVVEQGPKWNTNLVVQGAHHPLSELRPTRVAQLRLGVVIVAVLLRGPGGSSSRQPADLFPRQYVQHFADVDVVTAQIHQLLFFARSSPACKSRCALELQEWADSYVPLVISRR